MKKLSLCFQMKEREIYMATPTTFTTQFLSYIISLIRHHCNENPDPINDLDDMSLIKNPNNLYPNRQNF